jgi:hypothetical protein
MTSITWRDIPRHPRSVWPWLCATSRRFFFGPVTVAEAPPVSSQGDALVLIVECAACPAEVDSTTADSHGRCISCSAVAAAIEWQAEIEQAEADRITAVLEAEKAAAAERLTVRRGAGAAPRLPDEPAPVVPFAAHAAEVLPELIGEVPADPMPAPMPELVAVAEPSSLPLFDFLALGTVAASTCEEDAILNAQILLAEHHDVASIVAGFEAYVAAHPLARSAVAL